MIKYNYFQTRSINLRDLTLTIKALKALKSNKPHNPYITHKPQRIRSIFECFLDF